MQVKNLEKAEKKDATSRKEHAEFTLLWQCVCLCTNTREKRKQESSYYVYDSVFHTFNYNHVCSSQGQGRISVSFYKQGFERETLI